MPDARISALAALTQPDDLDLLPIVDVSVNQTKKITYADFTQFLRPTGFVFVDSIGDLPAPVGGVITLAANTTYFITNNLDLAGNRFVCSANTVILGGSSENCSIFSTGLSAATPLISSAWSLPIRNITITHGTALALDANGNANQAIDWFGVNFTNCATVGVIANYNNFIMTDSALLNSSGMTFDGTIGTVGFFQCLFDGQAGDTIAVPATATITRRLRIIYSSFVSLPGETSLNVSTSATIPVEGYILDTINFSGGGTYIAGVIESDNKALFENCRGITNSSSVCDYYMSNNALAADIVTAGVPVKAAGTTISVNAEKFSHSNNRATYIGALDRKFKVTATLSATSGNNNQIGCYIAKNGSVIGSSEVYSTTSGAGRAENITIQSIVNLSTNDFIEVWVENSAATNDIVVTYLNVVVGSV